MEREEGGEREREREREKSSTHYLSHIANTIFRLALNSNFDGFLRAPNPTVPGTTVSPDTESRCSDKELEEVVVATTAAAAACFLSLLISLQVSSSDSSDELSSSLGLPSSSCMSVCVGGGGGGGRERVCMVYECL